MNADELEAAGFSVNFRMHHRAAMGATACLAISTAAAYVSYMMRGRAGQPATIDFISARGKLHEIYYFA